MMIISLCVCSFALSAAAGAEAPAFSPEQYAAAIAQWREVQKSVAQQGNLIDSIRQSIAAGIQAGYLKAKDVEQAMKLLLEYGQQLFAIQKQLTDGMDPDRIINTAYYVRGITDLFSIQLKEGFSQTTAMSPETFLPRSEAEVLPVDELLKSNSEKLAALQKQVVEASLTPLNRAFRAVEHMANKLYVPQITYIALAIGGVVAAKAGYQYLTAKPPAVELNPGLLNNVVHSVEESQKSNPAVAESVQRLAGDTIAALKALGDDVNKQVDQAHAKFSPFTTAVVGGAVAGVLIQKISHALDWSYDKYAGPFWQKWREARGFVGRAHEYLRGTVDTLDKQDYTIVDDITFDSPELIGLDEQKQKLLVYVDFLRDPDLYLRTDRVPQHGVLLFGPSRTGKTLCARALAGTINKMFKDLGRPDKVSFREYTWEAMAIVPLVQIIADAQQHAPCIIFIDELHSLDLQTIGAKGKLSEFLTEFGTLAKEKDPQKQVFILAATNRPDMLDKALLSHERFGLQIEFFLPTAQHRREFFTKGLQAAGIFIDNLDVDSLARQTTGCAYGKLQEVTEHARLVASSMGEGVKQYHLQDGINQKVYEFTDTNELSERETKVVAAHQAGIACAHVLQQMNSIFEFVTIRGMRRPVLEINEWRDGKRNGESEQKKERAPQFGKVFTYPHDEHLAHIDSEERIRECKQLLAGAVAQDILLGSRSITYGVQDRRTAYDYALQLVLQGLELAVFSEAQQDAKRELAERMVQDAEAEVKKLLMQHRTKLQAVYEALLAERTLNGAQVAELCK